MKNIKYFLIIFSLIFLIVFFNKDLILILVQNLFDRILYFLSPIPTFPIIIFNGFIFNNIGFFFSYIILITFSLILFKLVNKIGFILNTR